jgi:molybdopterin molybdotransferase
VIPFEQALAAVLRETPLLSQEPVALADVAGRVLREDVRADADLPPFDRAAMDGYALRAEDVRQTPVRLRVIGELRAGEWPRHALAAGQALRVMTGAPVPDGTTAVQQVEKTRPAGDEVEILAPVEPGAHVARRGSEVTAGAIVLERGHVIDAAAVGVLAAVGCARPLVARRPRLALLVTGDELVAVEEAPAPGRIRNSNGPALATLALAAGAEVSLLGVAPDRTEALLSAITRAQGADLLVVSGGVSAGDYDLVEPALQQAGFTPFFTGVAIKPGAPLVFGRLGALLVFGLPGNPVSAQVTFELFVRPCLRRMQGARSLSRPRVPVELVSAALNRSGRTSHLPARVRWRDGRLVAELVRSAGSADLVAHARANALVVIEAGRSEVEAGESASALLLSSYLEEDDGAPS